jgi:hypothetical protein
MDRREAGQDSLEAGQFRRQQRVLDHLGGEGGESPQGERGVADMPGLGIDAAAVAVVRPEKAEASEIRVQPCIQRGEHPTRRVLPGQQLHPVPGRHGTCVVDIDVRAPVMAAGTGQRGPRQDRFQQLVHGQRRVVAGNAGAVIQRALAAELAVPDRGLRGQVAKRAEHGQVDVLARRRGSQPQEGLQGFAVQGRAQVVALDQMAARAAGELQLVHAGRYATLS